MRLIGLVVVLIVSLTIAPFGAETQEARQISRVGVLATFPRPIPANPRASYNAFLRELRNLGYVEGQNVVIGWHHTDGNPDRRRSEAATLMAWKPDVVVGINTTDAQALREADPSVPIVLAATGDLVGAGMADSLARPGGNVTGLQMVQLDTAPKRLQILKELMPRLQRVALLHETPTTQSAERFYAQLFADLDVASRTLALRFRRFTVMHPDDLDRVFADIKRNSDAVLISSSPLMVAHRPRLVDLAARYRLPAMHEVNSFVEAGGLISYGATLADLWRRAAHYVDRILKGAKPADLPVEQPTKFDLVINLKTAKALGLTIPQTLLLRADQVIE
jgi:putative tryptophan/tyrosine transport system substrate-binding protein